MTLPKIKKPLDLNDTSLIYQWFGDLAEHQILIEEQNNALKDCIIKLKEQLDTQNNKITNLQFQYKNMRNK